MFIKLVFKGGRPDVAMEHLTCFVPGWLALGIPHQSDASRAAKHLKVLVRLALVYFFSVRKYAYACTHADANRSRMENFLILRRFRCYLFAERTAYVVYLFAERTAYVVCRHAYAHRMHSSEWTSIYFKNAFYFQAVHFLHPFCLFMCDIIRSLNLNH